MNIIISKSSSKANAISQLERTIINNGSLHAHGYLLIHNGYEELTIKDIDDLSLLIISN